MPPARLRQWQTRRVNSTACSFTPGHRTLQGKAILERFVLQVCGCAGDWNMPDYIEEAVGHIRSQVGKEEVVLGFPAGALLVAAALIHRAIGKQLTRALSSSTTPGTRAPVRLNEAEQVMETFARNLGVKVIHADVREALRASPTPNRKRKIIGREFIEVFQREAAKLPQVKAQDNYLTSSSPRARDQEGPQYQVAPQCWRSYLKLLEPCASCSRTRCASLALPSGCHTTWCSGIRFPGPGLGRADPRRMGQRRMRRAAAPGRWADFYR